ncbi:MAG: hypothetical protein ACOX5Z_03895 [Desulfobulbus sp.]|jgi:hypothetical protein
MEQKRLGRQERRQAERFRSDDKVLVFMGMDTGTVVDIGRGGLAVHFVAFKQDIPFVRHLDIFHAGLRFFLQDVPVTLVNEVETLPKSVFSTLRIRRLCLCFGALSPPQQALLEDLIGSIALDGAQ